MPNQVVVFHMTGCGPCEEYIPRFKKAAIAYRGQLDIRSVNLSKSDKRYLLAAEKFEIEATPTTLVLNDADEVLQRKVGGLTDREIEALLKKAAQSPKRKR